MFALVMPRVMGQGVPVAENDGDVTTDQVFRLVYFHVKSGTVRGQDLAHLTAQRTQLRLDLPCAAFRSLKAFAPVFSTARQLVRFELDVAGSKQLTDVAALQDLACCKNLKFIIMSFIFTCNMR